MIVENKNAETAATVSAKKPNSTSQKEEVMNQTIRTTRNEIKCARCMCPPGAGEIFVDGMKLECPCHCHDGIPPAQAHAPEPKRYIGGELARAIYGNGGLRDRIMAKRNACTCGGV